MERTGERVVLEGLVAGVLAYLVVAVVYAVSDLALGRPLFATPAAIGGVLFYGVGDPASVLVSAGPVAAANGVHLLVSVVLGMAGALLALETERHPQVAYLVFALVILALFMSSTALLAVPTVIARIAPPAIILLANLAGAVVAAAYLLRVHPALRAEAEELAGEPEPGIAAR